MQVATPPSKPQCAEFDQPTTGPLKPLLLRSRDAARILGIGQRLLWSMTAPRGPIPCVRLGRRVLYPLVELEALIDSLKEGGRQ